MYYLSCLSGNYVHILMITSNYSLLSNLHLTPCMKRLSTTSTYVQNAAIIHRCKHLLEKNDVNSGWTPNPLLQNYRCMRKASPLFSSSQLLRHLKKKDQQPSILCISLLLSYTQRYITYNKQLTASNTRIHRRQEYSRLTITIMPLIHM